MPSQFGRYQSGIEAATGNLVPAYSQMAERTAKSLTNLGENIAEGIKKYSEGKAERELIDETASGLVPQFKMLSETIGQNPELSPAADILAKWTDKLSKINDGSLGSARATINGATLALKDVGTNVQLITGMNQMKKMSAMAQALSESTGVKTTNIPLSTQNGQFKYNPKLSYAQNENEFVAGVYKIASANPSQNIDVGAALANFRNQVSTQYQRTNPEVGNAIAQQVQAQVARRNTPNISPAQDMSYSNVVNTPTERIANIPIDDAIRSMEIATGSPLTQREIDFMHGGMQSAPMNPLDVNSFGVGTKTENTPMSVVEHQEQVKRNFARILGKKDENGQYIVPYDYQSVLKAFAPNEPVVKEIKGYGHFIQKANGDWDKIEPTGVQAYRKSMLGSFGSTNDRGEMMSEEIGGIGSGINVKGVFTGTDSNLNEFQNDTRALSRARYAVRELIKMANTTGKSLNPKDIGRARVLTAMVGAGIRKEVVGGGQVSDFENKLIQNIVADPTNLLRLDDISISALSELRDRIDSGITSYNGGHGIVITLNEPKKIDSEELTPDEKTELARNIANGIPPSPKK